MKFYRVVSSSPVDKKAAIVASKSRHNDPLKDHKWPERLHSDTPFQMRPVPKGPTNIDLTGEKFGRFIVVGLAAYRKEKKKANRWVCRCVCGKYELRSTRAIRSAMTNSDDCYQDECMKCRVISRMQNHDRIKQHINEVGNK